MKTKYMSLHVCFMFVLLACFGVVSFAAGVTVTGFTKKDACIVSIAAFTANGDQDKLAIAIREGLDAHLSVNEIKEVIVQLYAYAGFPRSLNALNTFMNVLKEQKAKGIEYAEGKVAGPYPRDKSNLEFGTENQTRLVGSAVKGPVYDFAPVVDQFLKQHLFGDIFGRDVIDWRTRELATIAALASLEGTGNQLRSHINVGIRNGLTASQLDSVVFIIRTSVGDVEGYQAARILDAVLKRAEKPADVNSNFTGSVFVKMIVPKDSVFNTQLASVTFDAGARTNWHYHRSGQILLITDGVAFYQEKGKPKQVLSRGEVIKCLPNVAHWHGASPKGSMTHMALSPNLDLGSVVWLESVSDEVYGK